MGENGNGRGQKTEAMRQEALSRAMGFTSLTNYPAILTGFTEKGIPTEEIRPRENVFTFNAWKALGRSVKKGEHGVRVITYAEGERKEVDENGDEKLVSFKRPWTTTVFHVSQTEAN